MPYPNEHSCRIRNPDDFQPKSFRRMERPKGVSLIIGRPKGKTTTATQAIRYDKEKWTADKAETDCEGKDGTFEAAAKESMQDIYEEASWKDIIALEDAVFSHNDKRDRLMTAVREKFGSASDRYGPWIRDMWDAYLIYEDSETNKFYKVGYTIDEKGTVALGDPKEVLVQTTYEEIAESLKGDKEAEEQVEIGGDFLELIEALKEDTIHLKIIQPGWGSSGYYSSEVLERDAPVYRTGTHMFWDHPSLSEEKDRPERSIRDLAGILTSDGRFNPNGSAGPGVYADAKVFGGYKGVLAELAPHIGISHRAMGKAKKGEAEGQKGNIIEQITAAQSVGFVTVPGAGGSILQMFEAAKGQRTPIEPNTREKEKADMTDEEKVALEARVQAAETERDTLRAGNDTLKTENETLKTDNARLSERMLLIDATAFVVAELKEKPLPDLTRQRLIENLGKNPPVKDGVLDEEAFKARIKETVDGEIEYLSKVAVSGAIRGMGSGGDASVGLKETFKAQYLKEGKSEEEAENLARTAAEGR